MLGRRWWGSLVVRCGAVFMTGPGVLGRWTARLARLGVVSIGERVVGVGAIKGGDEVPEGILLVEEAN